MSNPSQVGEIEALLQKLGGIPAVPEVACRVLKLVGSEDARLADIARLISKDQGLATQVLRTCNSAYYGLPQQVSSLSRAVALLGFKAVRNLVVIHSMPRRRAGTATFAENAIWTHSAAGAIVARLLAVETRKVDPEEAMLGGLLHDSGRLVLNLLMPEHYEPVMRAIYNRTGSSTEITPRSGSSFWRGGTSPKRWSTPSATITTTPPSSIRCP
jgi:HD-like signal output (HDOD) protein